MHPVVMVPARIGVDRGRMLLARLSCQVLHAGRWLRTAARATHTVGIRGFRSAPDWRAVVGGDHCEWEPAVVGEGVGVVEQVVGPAALPLGACAHPGGHRWVHGSHGAGKARPGPGGRRCPGGGRSGSRIGDGAGAWWFGGSGAGWQGPSGVERAGGRDPGAGVACPRAGGDDVAPARRWCGARWRAGHDRADAARRRRPGRDGPRTGWDDGTRRWRAARRGGRCGRCRHGGRGLRWGHGRARARSLRAAVRGAGERRPAAPESPAARVRLPGRRVGRVG